LSDTESGGDVWRRTSPLAAIFFLGKIYEAIAKNAIQSFAPLAAFLVAYQGDLTTSLILGGTGFVVITAVIAFLRYWFFRYRIQEQSILIRDGVVKKTQLDIKFDRVQAINTEQNVVFRWFDLITVRFDTAGSSQQEGYLPAIKSSLAEELQQRLAGIVAAAPADAEEEPTPTPAMQPVLSYSLLDVVKVGLTSNRALIFLAFLAPVIEPAIESWTERQEKEEIESTALQAAQVGILEGVGLLFAIVFAVALILIILSIAGALLRYHGFILVTDDERLRSTGGLLTRHEHSVRFGKVQAVHLTQNMMHWLFDRFRWRAKQAASGRESAKKSFIVPIVDSPQLYALTQRSFAGEFPDLDIDPRSEHFQRISRKYVRSRTMLVGVYPALAAIAVLWIGLGFGALMALLWIPFGFLYALRRYRRMGLQLTTDGIAFRNGFVGYRVVAHLMRKVQRVNVTQSPFQRRKGLANLRLYLASGTVKIPYLPIEDAQTLRDVILYKVEASDRAWH